MPNEESSRNRQLLPLEESIYFTHADQKAKISMISTPIGNLNDLTIRARNALEKADELWCEDTRHTQLLLNLLGISRPRLKRVDQHSSDDELRRMLKNVKDLGQWIGVVTDAGTPGISDPGARIAELLIEFPEVRLEPIPGASAVSAFVSISGMSSPQFTFHGFFPRKDSEILELLSDLKSYSKFESHVFFESPKRIVSTIESLSKWCEERDFTPKFVFAKELTKIHESIWQGQGRQFLEQLPSLSFDERGEWVFSVTLPKKYVINRKVQADWELTLECLIFARIPTKEAASIIADRFPVAKKLAYQSALELQKKIKK